MNLGEGIAEFLTVGIAAMAVLILAVRKTVPESEVKLVPRAAHYRHNCRRRRWTVELGRHRASHVARSYSRCTSY